MLLALGWTVVACSGPVANPGPPTEVVFFVAEATDTGAWQRFQNTNVSSDYRD